MATSATGLRTLGARGACTAILVGSVGCGAPSNGAGVVDLGSGNPAGDGGGATSVDADDTGSPSASGDDGSSPGSTIDASGNDAASSASPDGGSDGGASADSGIAPQVDGGTDGATASYACAGGTMGEASDATGAMETPVNGYGDVEFNISTQTQVVGLHTTLTVPAKPPASGTLFLWPGLQPLPGGKNYNPIGNGVLQPVLTWGGTCAPTAPNSYASWWISGQYVNTYASDQGHTGCLGGQGMDVAVGDPLDIAMTLSGTVWNQTVVDRQTGNMATFAIDMDGQAQDWAIFTIESDGSEPISDVVFTSTTLTLAAADSAGCQPSTRGQDDYFAAPQSSTDGKSCCVSKIILRAKGVAATTPNAP
jgi:hypothetical protein